VPAGLRRWLRPALVAAPILVILITLLSLHLSGSFLSTGVIAKAYAAMEGLRSYRALDDGYLKQPGSDELVHSWSFEYEYAGPDRYHTTYSTPEGSSLQLDQEVIVIGNRIYSRGVTITTAEQEQQLRKTFVRRVMENTLEQLDSLINVEEMPDENIDGVDCYHYKGTGDIEKLIEYLHIKRVQQWEKAGFDTSSAAFKEANEQADNMWRNSEIIQEFWIGKDDYLIRQWKSLQQPLPGKSGIGVDMAVEICNYYDFNEPIVIEPPLTESGELLPGWYLLSLE
jgi:hypothetical protein